MSNGTKSPDPLKGKFSCGGCMNPVDIGQPCVACNPQMGTIPMLSSAQPLNTYSPTTMKPGDDSHFMHG